MRGSKCKTCGYEPTGPGESCACLLADDELWNIIMGMSSEELDESLRREGIDPNGLVDRVLGAVAKRIDGDVPWKRGPDGQ